MWFRSLGLLPQERGEPNGQEWKVTGTLGFGKGFEGAGLPKD